VIRRSIVQKKCQKSVNTRENATSDDEVYVYHEVRAHRQSMALSRSFRRYSFSLPEVFQTCSQLIHTPFVAALASGLETRNQSRKRQEKNEFYFQLRQKNFLDGKKKRAFRPENRSGVSKKFRAGQTATIPDLRGKQMLALIPHAPRVDRIGLCGQFLASARGAKPSANCRCSQSIPIPTGAFRCTLRVRITR
jgi:hypothetical protein